MTDTMTAAGYIITDNEGTLHGSGETVDAAWADAEATMADAGIEMLDDDADSTECMGNWTRRSGLRVLPASPALLDLVDSCGGLIAWVVRDGVAITLHEADEQDAA